MAGFRNFVIGCVAGAASILTPMAQAQAVPMAAPNVTVGQQVDVQTVNHRRGHYRPRPYYGHRPYYGRDRYYRPGFGVYIAPRRVYRDPYIRRSYGGSHVSWCLSRYRSYNPATNRFLAYGGVYRICRSPYR